MTSKIVIAIAWNATGIAAVTEHESSAAAIAAAAMAQALGFESTTRPVWFETTADANAKIAAQRTEVEEGIAQDRQLAAAAAISPNYSES